MRLVLHGQNSFLAHWHPRSHWIVLPRQLGPEEWIWENNQSQILRWIDGSGSSCLCAKLILGGLIFMFCFGLISKKSLPKSFYFSLSIVKQNGAIRKPNYIGSIQHSDIFWCFDTKYKYIDMYFGFFLEVARGHKLPSRPKHCSQRLHLLDLLWCGGL